MNFVEDNFNCSANQMMNARPKPKVAWLAKQDEDTFVAGDAWVEWMVTDAGFVPYPDYKTTYNQTYLLKALKTADIVIDATGGLESFGDFLETYGITDGGMDSEYPFIKYKMVFRTDRIVNDLGNSEWDVEAWTRPEEALMDLIDTAFETYKPGYNKRWMRNIAKCEYLMSYWKWWTLTLLRLQPTRKLWRAGETASIRQSR